MERKDFLTGAVSSLALLSGTGCFTPLMIFRLR